MTFLNNTINNSKDSMKINYYISLASGSIIVLIGFV